MISEIFSKIMALPPLMQNLFMAEITQSYVSANRDHTINFLTLLKHASPEAKEAFYTIQESREYWENLIKRFEPLDRTTLPACSWSSYRLQDSLKQGVGKPKSVTLNTKTSSERNGQ